MPRLAGIPAKSAPGVLAPPTRDASLCALVPITWGVRQAAVLQAGQAAGCRYADCCRRSLRRSTFSPTTHACPVPCGRRTAPTRRTGGTPGIGRDPRPGPVRNARFPAPIFR